MVYVRFVMRGNVIILLISDITKNHDKTAKFSPRCQITTGASLESNALNTQTVTVAQKTA